MTQVCLILGVTPYPSTCDISIQQRSHRFFEVSLSIALNLFFERLCICFRLFPPRPSGTSRPLRCSVASTLKELFRRLSKMTADNPIDALAGQFSLKIVDSEGSDTSTDKIGVDTPKTGTAEKDSRLKDATTGSISDIKDLYQGPEDSQGRAQWLDKYPEDAEEAAENEDTEKYALIARKKKCFDGRKKFDIDSIIVQSPELKKVLGKVFDKYPGVTCELDRLIFSAPFQPFVHRCKKLRLSFPSRNEIFVCAISPVLLKQP